MSGYDPFADTSDLVSIGAIEFRLGYVAHCLGIPAATLAALRAGTHVVVPREIIDRFPEINPSNYGPDDVDALNAWGVELVLAASEAPGHD